MTTATAAPTAASTTEILTQMHLMILAIEHAEGLINWTQAEISDAQLGRDMDALRQHLQNAAGRCNSCIGDVRLINRVGGRYTANDAKELDGQAEYERQAAAAENTTHNL